MEIVKIEMNLKAVNKSIALFNCEKKVSGVIHSNSTGETTVILDGGYVLGKFDCPHCAVEAISLLTVKVSDGEQAGFGNYRSYKLDYTKKILSDHPLRKRPPKRACPVRSNRPKRTGPNNQIYRGAVKAPPFYTN